MIAPGSIIGHRYRIVDEVGTGGMAHVYRAVNLTSHKTVAIKMLKEEYINDAEFLRRFEREAKAVLHLSHDNIVRAYGVGEHDGLPYIVLEFVDGQTLKQILNEHGPMPPRLAVNMTLQVLDALSAAHAAGIIHRDVKPQNVIVTEAGTAKLTDFGIARDADSSTMTFAGNTVLGSVHYLSPEQAKGRPVTEGSDLYSTGIMLYELLTGQVPFTGDNSVAIALMHLRESPKPPIELNTRIPPSLNDVIMRALNKDLNQRYATAAEMSHHLKRALQEPNGDFARTYNPSSAVIASPVTPSAKKKRHKPAHGALKIGVAVAALVAILIGVFLVTRDSLQSDVVALEIVPALTDRSVDEARQKAENYGFVLNVSDFESNDTVPYGNVISQSPLSGAKARPGSEISVIVSSGPTAPIMPDLLGKTQDEAVAELHAIGLELGKVEYRISDIAIGYVCAQSVLEGTEVSVGTKVNICISATSSTSYPMPLYIDELLKVALGELSEVNAEKVFVRYNPRSRVENGIIIGQSPNAQTAMQPASSVLLTVSGDPSYEFSADVAFNLSIESSASYVVAAVEEVYNGFSYYRVLFDATLEKGSNVPISFTATSETEGAREIILFLNGEEQKRQEFSFARKEGK